MCSEKPSSTSSDSRVVKGNTNYFNKPSSTASSDVAFCQRRPNKVRSARLTRASSSPTQVCFATTCAGNLIGRHLPRNGLPVTGTVVLIVAIQYMFPTGGGKKIQTLRTGDSKNTYWRNSYVTGTVFHRRAKFISCGRGEKLNMEYTNFLRVIYVSCGRGERKQITLALSILPIKKQRFKNTLYLQS